MTAIGPRDEARDALRLYQARTGLSLGEIGVRIGYAPHSLVQFASTARYGDGDGTETARCLLDFFQANPPEVPVTVIGRLYVTQNVRIIDDLIHKVHRGHWALLYGPAGTQKTYVFKTRAAESYARALEPEVVWIHAQEGMAPLALLAEIATALGAYVKRDRHSMLRSILYTLRRRKLPLALIIDDTKIDAKARYVRGPARRGGPRFDWPHGSRAR